MNAVTGTGSTVLDALSVEAVDGQLCERLDGLRVRCVACAHRCLVLAGRRGICRVRFNQAGRLMVPWGYVSGLHGDPIEKKPFYHVLPGSNALTFGMLGCNLHCAFCQNWDISQVGRDPVAGGQAAVTTPEQIVAAAIGRGSRLVVSSYNEPLITSEWAADVFRLARSRGLRTAYVSNGYASPEVLEYLRPVVDCFKVDLKGMSNTTYRRLGGRLDHVLATIRRLVGMGKWVEVVTLVVPGLNDSAAELRLAAEFLASVSTDIPWHLTAFHPDYEMTDAVRTPAETLLAAVMIGRSAGLHFVYAGNLPGQVGPWEDTRCPQCSALLVQRAGFRVLRNRLKGGECPDCGSAVPGVLS